MNNTSLFITYKVYESFHIQIGMAIITQYLLQTIYMHTQLTILIGFGFLGNHKMTNNYSYIFTGYKMLKY